MPRLGRGHNRAVFVQMSFESPSPYHAFQDSRNSPDQEFRRQKAEAKGLFTCGGQCRRWCRRLGRWLLCGSEEPESRYIRLNVARPTPHSFPSNRVVNTKYTALSFFPKVPMPARPPAPAQTPCAEHAGAV